MAGAAVVGTVVRGKASALLPPRQKKNCGTHSAIIIQKGVLLQPAPKAVYFKDCHGVSTKGISLQIFRLETIPSAFFLVCKTTWKNSHAIWSWCILFSHYA